MNLIKKYRPYGIPVTNLCSQLWCEKQFEFSLEHGRRITKGMKKGKDRHEELHEEIVELVELIPRSYEDRLAIKLRDCYTGLKNLLAENITREIPVWGKVNSLFVVGVIDEINFENNNLKILDNKTRRSNRMPTMAQKRTTQFQLMIYHHLLRLIKKNEFSARELLRNYGFDSNSKITNSLIKQVNKVGENIEPNLLKLAKDTFASIGELPELSNDLHVRYEYQKSKEIIGVDKFTFDPFKFQKTCNFVEEFWLGKRNAKPVSSRNKWKCKFCEFKEMCDNCQL